MRDKLLLPGIGDLQIEGTASVTDLRQDCVLHVRGIAKRPVWQSSEQGNKLHKDFWPW